MPKEVTYVNISAPGPFLNIHSVINKRYEEYYVGPFKKCFGVVEPVDERDDNLINTGGNFTCSCSEGYYASDGVGNVNTITGQCTAANTWTKNDCITDIDECNITANLCQNGGTCIDLPLTYSCTCTQFWTGTNCQTDVNECNNNPCQNGGVCENLPGTYSCTCTQFWTGTNCQTDVNECNNNPCLNGGTCINLPGTYSCTCVPGWGGTICEIAITATACPYYAATNVISSGCQYSAGPSFDQFDIGTTATCDCSAGYASDTGNGIQINVECTVTATWSNNENCVPVCSKFDSTAEMNMSTCVYNACDDNLINTGGNFNCSCSEGYASDGGNGIIITGQCTATNTWTKDNCIPVCTKFASNVEGCNYINTGQTDDFLNEDGSFSCDCIPGFLSVSISGDDTTTIGASCKNDGTWTNYYDCFQGSCHVLFEKNILFVAVVPRKNPLCLVS